MSESPGTGDAGELSALDDQSLLEAARGGRPEAFDLIVVRHQKAVYRLCRRFVGDHEDASDVTQEVFLRAWRALDRFRGQSAVSTWLYRIAVNACLSRRASRPPLTQPLVDDVPASGGDVSGELVRRERAARVRDAIARLPDRQRATVILRVYHELTHQAIAEILGSSVGATKTNLFHALRNLRRRLDGDPR